MWCFTMTRPVAAACPPAYAAAAISVFGKTDQEEWTGGRPRAAFDQFHSARASEPLCVTRPCELGTPAQLTHHRLKPLFDEATHSGIRTDAAQQEKFRAGAHTP